MKDVEFIANEFNHLNFFFKYYFYCMLSFHSLFSQLFFVTHQAVLAIVRFPFYYKIIKSCSETVWRLKPFDPRKITPKPTQGES